MVGARPCPVDGSAAGVNRRVVSSLCLGRRRSDAAGGLAAEGAVAGGAIYELMIAAEEAADKGMAQLRASNPQWHMGYEIEAQEAKRLELTVTAVRKSEPLAESLDAVVIAAERYRRPKEKTDEELAAQVVSSFAIVLFYDDARWLGVKARACVLLSLPRRCRRSHLVFLSFSPCLYGATELLL